MNTTTKTDIKPPVDEWPLENGAQAIAFVHTRPGQEAIVLARWGNEWVVWRAWLEERTTPDTFQWHCGAGFYTNDLTRAVRDLCVRGGVNTEVFA